MRHVFAVKLESGAYISHKGYHRNPAHAIEFGSPEQAVRAAEKRSGSIDEPISLEKRAVK